MGGKGALKTLADVVLENLDGNGKGKGGIIQELEESRLTTPLKQIQNNEDGKSSGQVLHCLNQLRTQLDDTSLMIQVTGIWDPSPKESMIKIGALFEILQKIKLENEKVWVNSVLERLNYLITEGLEDHYVPYKTLMLSKKDTAACSSRVSKSEITEILNEISPGKRLEDWDLNTDNMRDHLLEPDSFELHQRWR